MPLYTYLSSFKGATCVTQDRRSNFRGFVNAWTSELPANALPALTPSLRKELGAKAYGGEFAEVPNRKNVWRKVIDLSGEEFVVYAIQTEV
jgi:hypothetical protein